MDINTIIKVFKIYTKSFIIIQLLSSVVIYFISFIVVFAVMTIAKPDTYVNISGFFSALVFLITSFLLGIVTFCSGYSFTVKWGISRKNYLAGILLYHITVAISFFMLILITQTEGYVNQLLYGSFALLNMEPEHIFPSVLSNPLYYVVPPLICTIICTILGPIALKFGANVLAIIYAIIISSFSIFSASIKEVIKFLENSSFMELHFAIKLILVLVIITTTLAASIKFYLKYDVS